MRNTAKDPTWMDWLGALTFKLVLQEGHVTNMTWKRDTEVDCDGTGNAHKLNMHTSYSQKNDKKLDS